MTFWGLDSLYPKLKIMTVPHKKTFVVIFMFRKFLSGELLLGGIEDYKSVKGFLNGCLDPIYL